MPTTKEREWNLMMRAWNRNPAFQYEVASRYAAKYPRSAVAYLVLADGLGDMARYREAKAALRRANRVVPPDQRWHVAAHWGHLYKKMFDLRWAERWYRLAVRIHPSTTTQTYLGGVLARRGRLALAKRHYLIAVGLASNPETDAKDEAFLNLGFILRSEGKYREAAVMFRKALRIDPNYKEAREALADVLEAIQLRKARRRIGVKTKQPA